MKKIPILIALLYVIAAAITDGFTYINGKLNPMITKWIWIAGIVSAVLYILINPVKKISKNEKVVPFREE